MLNLDNLGETILVIRDKKDFELHAPDHAFPISGVTNFLTGLEFECAFIWSDYSYTFLNTLMQELDINFYERGGIMQNGAILETVRLVQSIFMDCDGAFVMQGECEDEEELGGVLDDLIDSLTQKVEFVLHMKNNRYLHYFEIIGGRIKYRLVSGAFFAFGADARLATTYRRNGYSWDEIYEEIIPNRPSLKYSAIEQLWEADSSSISNTMVVPKEQEVKNEKVRKEKKRKRRPKKKSKRRDNNE